MRSLSKKSVALLLISLTLLSQSSAMALYYGPAKVRTTLNQENLASVLLPQFRRDVNSVELKVRSTIDLIVEKDAKKVQVQVVGANGAGLGIDSNTLISKGIKIFTPSAIRAADKSPSTSTKNLIGGNKPVTINLTKKQNQFLIIEADDFKVVKIGLTGILPGSYKIEATIDGLKKTTTQVFTKPQFRIDALTPTVIVRGVETTISLIGKGFDSLTQVVFNDSGILVEDVQNIDDDTLLKVKVFAKDTVSFGAKSVTVADPFTANTAALVGGLIVSSDGSINAGGINGADGMDGINGVDGMGLCNSPTALLMTFTNNLPAGSQATIFLDPVQCNLTFGIPVGFNGANVTGVDGMGLCNTTGITPTTVVNTVSYGTPATVSLDPNACTLTYNIPEGKPGSLISSTTEAAGANCATGGQKIETGVDANDNATLDSGEVNVAETSYVCNGANGTNGTGHNSLISVTTEAAGANCAAGGQKVENGVDTNDDTVLQVGEVTSTRYVCNGAAGATGATGATGTNGTNGTNGHNSLVNVTAEAAGANCATGGQKVESGIDSNDSGTLAAGEITTTTYVCNGDNSLPSISYVIQNWNTLSDEQDYTTVGGAMARMVKIPYFIHDGVTYGGFWVDKYEASRSDATASAAGSSTDVGSKRNVVPYASLNLATAQAAGTASNRRITTLGPCHITGMKEWYTLYLLGRYSKASGLFGATATNGWNERGNTRASKDGRNSGSFICSDDPTESGATVGRCLTGTGFKSWGHLLDGSATTNPTGTSLGGSADATANGTSAFDGDKQVYDLVGNVREWVDFTVTAAMGGPIVVDTPYDGVGTSLPFITNNSTFNFINVAQGALDGLGFPNASGSTTDTNGGANSGKILTTTTAGTYGTIRGGSWLTTSDSPAPLYCDITQAVTATATSLGFRVTCDQTP